MLTVFFPVKPNASLQLLPEAGAERSTAEAGGSQLQGVVRQGPVPCAPDPSVPRTPIVSPHRPGGAGMGTP